MPARLPDLQILVQKPGIGGTITTLAVAREKDVQALLNIPAHFAVAALVPAGKPVKQLTRLKRRSVGQIAVHERFDGRPFSKP